MRNIITYSSISLFFLFAGIPLVTRGILLTIYYFTSNNSFFVAYVVATPILGILSALFYFTWLWKIIDYLLSQRLELIELNAQFIKAIYSLSLLSIVIYNILELLKNIYINISIMKIVVLIFIVSFLLLNLILAKSIRKIELNRNATIVEYLPTTLWLTIYPIGIWFIQPRVKKLYMSNE